MHLRSFAPLLLLLLAGRLHGITIGTETFDYANGAIAGHDGGTGFNRDLFDGEVTSTPSDWDVVTGAPGINANALRTNNTAAKREYNGDIEGVGDGSNDGQDNHERSGALRAEGRVYYRVDLTRGGSASWSGISSYDFGAERIFFGVPGGNGPSGGPEFACQISGGGTYFSGIAANTSARTLVTVLDFDHDFIGLWVDPDGSDFYNEVTGDNSADAGGTYNGTNWSTAARLGSGGQATWDNLSVVTRWTDLGYVDPNDTDSDGMRDSWETAHGLVVGTDDSALDADDDGLLNLAEFLRETDPQDGDSDGDGFSDGAEVQAGTNPNSAASYPGAVLPEDVVGTERFAYPDGPIAGRTGGLYWDYDNSYEDDAFIGHAGTPSDWNAAFGDPVVSGEALITQNSGATREYNGPVEGAQGGSDERAGAVNGDGNFESGTVYYKFSMTRGANVEWSGASSYDFATERYLFGIPGAANPASGNREFAIHDLNAGQWAYSGIAPVTGQTYTLVAKLDFDNDVAALYLNPTLGAAEELNTPVAVYPHTSQNWSSAVRLASGGSGQVTWDNLRVAHTWSGLEDGPPVAHDDSITMHHLGKARLKVLDNDTGGIAPASLSIVAPPAHGSASVNADGTILYQHLNGTPASETFTYRIESPDAVLSDTGTVTINFSAAPRFDTGFVSLPAAPPPGALMVEDAFPGMSFDSPHGFSTIPGDSHKLFVTEGDGRVFLIPDMAAAVPQKLPILNLTTVVQHDNNELAMKGIAVHPQWASNGYIYVTYNTKSGFVRLARYTCQTTPPYTAGAEEILIDQQDDDGIHSIGSCEFGPDGYLYVSFGDEGTQEDGHNNSQHVDRNLWSCVIRIDVDKKPGSLVPNPNPGPDPYSGPDPGGQSNDADLAIPRLGGGSSGEARYAIPPDNPLVGSSSFNGIPLVPGQIRTEIFVTGVRNPWQFSAEDTDGNGSVDELWVGDVGRSDREDLSVFHPGDDGGWGWMEGSIPGVRAGDNLNGAPQSAATLTPPLWDYPHGGGTFEGASITGGFIYRGTALPGLTGKYICADYVSGNIWSIDRSGPEPVIERIAGEVGLVGLLPDPVSGGILLLDRGNTGGNQGIGGIKRLKLGSDDSSFPPTLSRTNFFADLADLTPNPGGHFYEPNLRFWSDRAEKKRWFLIKSSADTVGYQQDAPWTYPAGMIWVKHFDYPTQWETFTRSIDGQNFTDRRPVAGSPRRRLETRFLVRNETGAYGISYHWNNVNSGSQTDAALADDDGETFGIDITLDGNPSAATWQIPSRTNCMTCHTAEAGHALSFNTRQMNAAGTLSGASGNMISLLADAGYLSGAPADPGSLPRHHRPDESGESLESRVRSYLAVNCAYCHQAGGTGGGNWDGRAHLSLAQTGLINGPTVDTPLHPGDLLVVPGEVPKSIIYNRVAAANGYTRMPPLASDVVDLEGAQLLADWIGQAGQPPFATYQEWRIARFGNGTSPEGAAGENPDGDRLDNFGEWAFGTNPQAADDARSVTALLLVQPGAGDFHFTHRRLQAHAAAGIDYSYRVSDNLTDWAGAAVIEESAVAIPGDPGYELVTLSLAPGQMVDKHRLFLQVVASP